MSPDPYKANNGGSGDSTDPGSWNGYSYVENDPIDHYDPEGLFMLKPPPPDPLPVGPLEPPISPPQPQPVHLGPKSAFPECNPTGDKKTEAKLDWIADTAGAAIDQADSIAETLAAISPTLNVSATTLATAFVEWSAWETGWGAQPVFAVNNNYFGMATGSWGGTTVTCPSGAAAGAACFQILTFAYELQIALGGVPHTENNPNPGDATYLGFLESALIRDPGMGAADMLQTIANAGWNTNPNYGSSIVGLNLQALMNCMLANNYI
jgi:hypothetical protein